MEVNSGGYLPRLLEARPIYTVIHLHFRRLYTGLLKKIDSHASNNFAAKFWWNKKKGLFVFGYSLVQYILKQLFAELANGEWRWIFTDPRRVIDAIFSRLGKGAVTESNFSCKLYRNVQKRNVAVARTGVLHCAIGLPATRKTATEEDEERIKRIVIGRSSKELRDKLHGAGRGEGCYTAQCWKSKYNRRQYSLRKIKSSSIFCNAAATRKLRDKLLSRYATLSNFWCNLRRKNIAKQVAWSTA